MKAIPLIAISILLLISPIILSIAFLVLFAMASSTTAKLPAGPHLGDNIVPDAVMVYDQLRVIHAPPSDVW